MHVQLLGTSGFGITQSRKLPASIINHEILVDFGEGTLETLIAQKIDIKAIKAILITHLHADHTLGLISFLYTMAFYQLNADLTQKRKSPPIYVPEGMKKNLIAIIEATYSTFGNTNYELDIRELKSEGPKREIQIQTEKATYQITWQKTVHSPLCHAYKINGDLVFSGDSAPFPAMAEFCKGVKVLIHESSFPDGMEIIAHRVNHSCPSDVATLAKNANIQQVILNHVPDLTEANEQDFLSGAQKIFTNISVAHDGDQIEI